MLNNYLEGVNTLPQQVEENKKDIEIIKQYIQPIYNTNGPLDPIDQNILLITTNAPNGTDKGWVLSQNGNLFKIVTNEIAEGQEKLILTYYCSIVGKEGIGIEKIENNGYSQGEGFTITHIKATLTNETEEFFDIHALDGNLNANFITINQPETATSGNITEEQLAVLQASKDNYILFNNEKYILMDPQHVSGALVYSHVGLDNNFDYWVKCITITINTLSWVLNATKLKTYHHKITFSDYAGCEIVIINKERTTFTVETLATYLTKNNFLENNSIKGNLERTSGNIMFNGCELFVDTANELFIKLNGFSFSIADNTITPNTQFSTGKLQGQVIDNVIEI